MYDSKAYVLHSMLVATLSNVELTSSRLKVGLSTYRMTSSDLSSTSYPSGRQYTCSTTYDSSRNHKIVAKSTLNRRDAKVEVLK